MGDSGAFLHCAAYRIDLKRPVVMAILNLTTDSFSGDGLARAETEEVLVRAKAAIDAGAQILDVGAESTRPGAEPVSEAEELARIVPVVTALSHLGVPVSVDTMKPRVMSAAIRAGAAMINDVNGFRAPGAIEAVASHGVGLCIMHMRGEPRTMQHGPAYGDVVAEVGQFLGDRLKELAGSGVNPNRICVDPGFGFGKSLEHNLELLRRLAELAELGRPVLIGLSRKSMLGTVTGRAVDGRIHASVAAALMAVERGARILRVHDVAATRDALVVWEAVANA